ncbi:hypothetical protein AAC387_Pa02g1721 [Persea americana]
MSQPHPRLQKDIRLLLHRVAALVANEPEPVEALLLQPAALLQKLEWDEVGRMPKMMFKWFEDSPKLKAFGGGDWVYVSGKSVRRVAMWNSSSSDWRWLHGVDGHRKSVRKGFVFDATLTAVP